MEDCRSTEGLNLANGQDKAFLTRVEGSLRVHYIFASLDRPLLGDECHDLAQKYSAIHKRMISPGEALFVDLRPAFREPLAQVLPQFCAVSKDKIPKSAIRG